MRWLSTSVALAAVVAAAAFVTASAGAARTFCPSGGTPPPGSVITGGLEVDGFECHLTNVTVYGGITVDATGAGELPFGELSIEGSTVNGGIVVNGGSLDIGIDGFFPLNRTFNPTTINGGVTLNQPIFFTAADATIHGGFTMNGIRDPRPVFGCNPTEVCFGTSWMCANDVWGNVAVRDASLGQVFLGDPGEVFYSNGAFCDGNTIHGSMLLKDSNFINPFSGEGHEIEGNTVTGSVRVDHSTGEVFGNTIGGSLLCMNGAVMQPAPAGDPSGTTNTVRGANTCF